MIRRLAALILHSTLYLIQTAEVPHQISLTVVELGGDVSFQCPVSKKESNFFHWYKQPLGYMIQLVAAVTLGKMTISDTFKDSRFTVIKKDAQYVLTIRNVSKEDEATYFCQHGTAYSLSFVNGIFLAVNDYNQEKFVNVRQRPETTSAQPGQSETLQCSLLSKNKENRAQCPGEHNMYWFRAGSGKSHPSIIYAHKNRSDEQKERSCVYRLPKTMRGPSDTGTYYCAMVTCEEILFGKGTQVDRRPELDPVVLVLGVLLACCVTVNIASIFYVKRRRVCQHCKGAMNAANQHQHDKPTVDQSDDLDDEAKEVNYAALDFTTRKVKRGKKRESLQESVYSVVTADYHNQQHPSL